MSQSIAPSRSDLNSDFYHYRLILFQEINTNTIMQKLLFLVWLFFSIQHANEIYPSRAHNGILFLFILFYLLPLYEYIAICSCNFPLVMFLGLETVQIFSGSHHSISEYLLWCGVLSPRPNSSLWTPPQNQNCSSWCQSLNCRRLNLPSPPPLLSPAMHSWFHQELFLISPSIHTATILLALSVPKVAIPSNNATSLTDCELSYWYCFPIHWLL